ncbi:phosphotransferase [Mycoplasma phocoeninasale]|uniref:Aminoglycoside phosphotransferase domain-containing protein n=1 Tax=Mycoplasma phocoeninasale TaxID=2726117 RepID=A0A858U4Y4_9MOLU|nr:phosphotransferase [Mycoplasma phocoeninasale]MBN0970565.1 hypothetical protein [Mycoplasma phocoeninasale]QJG66315.1 hypothetical protein HGG64_01140 [Mycoplasma phocoeninasale]
MSVKFPLPINLNLNKHKNAKFSDVYSILKKEFGADLAQKISIIRFYYEDFHNKSYIGKLDNKWVQIRIPRNIIKISYDNEMEIVSHFNDYLYFKNGVVIRKWFSAVDFFKIKIDDKISWSILHCVKNFQNLNILVEKFNWLKYPIRDKKYLELVKKYKNDELVLSHNNLKRQNILVNKHGFIKLIDFEFSTLNSRYVDPVCLYFLGINKQLIINFFGLSTQKFDDYVYMLKIYNEFVYKKIYANLSVPNNVMSASMNQYNNKNFLSPNRFIVQKNHSQFDNRLSIKSIEDFYFVPTYVYEDDNILVWKWLNCPQTQEINVRQIKILAKAMRTYHDSDHIFPEYILDKKVGWYLENIDKRVLKEDFCDKAMYAKIIKWLKEIKPDANCHNNLNLDNIFFTDNLNLYIIDWAMSYRNSRFLDIAYMFENTHLKSASEIAFWKAYEMPEPNDFYKYRIMIHFLCYLRNRTLSGDCSKAGANLHRIKELWKKYVR